MSIKEIPISKPSRIIKQQAEATIQNLIDAVVELVTNCDDSYSRLENTGKHPSGKIEIYVSREKGGRCRKFKIRDYAEGMSKKSLEKAIAYGEESSGFIEGKTVRGLLGRGLKESILGLGEGKIYTKNQGVINCVKIWWDEKERKALYEFLDDFDKRDFDISKFVSSKGNGTLIKIVVRNEKIKIPEGDKLRSQIVDHYALRDINSSKNREIILTFENFGRRRSKISAPIQFVPLEGKQVVDKSFSFSGYRDSIQLKIWKSPKALFYQRYNPCSKAGILIKTKGATLDNHLFKYENDPSAFYFWGEAHCEGITSRLMKAVKKGRESEIIDLTRKGLNWRSRYCGALRGIIEKQLAPLIQRKKRELEKGEKKVIPQNAKKMLKDICRLLENLAKKEFEDWEGPRTEEFEELTIIPGYANIEVGKTRPLSIYAPRELVKSAGSKVSVMSENADVKILFPGTKRLGLSWNIDLGKHPTNSNTWYRFIKVIGYDVGKEVPIYCRLGTQQAMATVKVINTPIEAREIVKRKRKKQGGFISDIIPNSMISDPIQRVKYEESLGKMEIYVKFPGVERYFGSELKEIESREESRAILAELIGEAFCKVLARKKIETNGLLASPEGQIDAFNSEVNNMQKKYLDKIHEIILNWKFK